MTAVRRAEGLGSFELWAKQAIAGGRAKDLEEIERVPLESLLAESAGVNTTDANYALSAFHLSLWDHPANLSAWLGRVVRYQQARGMHRWLHWTEGEVARYARSTSLLALARKALAWRQARCGLATALPRVRAGLVAAGPGEVPLATLEDFSALEVVDQALLCTGAPAMWRHCRFDSRGTVQCT